MPHPCPNTGAGEKELSAAARTKDGYDFTKWGRVNYTLNRRCVRAGGRSCLCVFVCLCLCCVLSVRYD